MDKLQGEVFKEVNLQGFENYLVSNLGRVSNGKKIMKTFKTSDGYERICFTNNGKQKKFTIHRLVAFTFIGIPKESNMQVNHINFDRTDNRVENLEWLTPKENIHYSINAGNIDLDRLRNQSKYANQKACEKRRRQTIVKSLNGDFVQTFASLVECENITGLCRKALGAVARGEKKQYKGYIAEYI